MRAELMTWVQRVVGAVFLIGVAALIAIGIVLVQQAEGVPPLPVLVTVLGLVALILLSGACLSLCSIAISAWRGSEALRLIARNDRAGVSAPVASEPEPDAARRPFSGKGIAAVPGAGADTAAPTAVRAPDRSARRQLVAER